MTFWKTASHEEKAAQIIAGRELGLTWEQIGMNCGALGSTIHSYSDYYGLTEHFNYRIYGSSRRLRESDKSRKKTDRSHSDFSHNEVKDLTQIFK